MRSITLSTNLGSLAVLLLLALVFGPCTGQAATVVFSSPTHIANDSSGQEILTSGTYEFGFNAGAGADPSGPTAVTVGSTTFYRNGGVNPTFSDVTLSLSGSINNPPDAPYDNKASGTTYSADLFDVLAYGFVSDTGGSFTVTLENLTIGTQYRAQFIGGQLGIPPDRAFSITSGGVTSGSLASNVNMTSIVGIFTADASSQAFVISGNSGDRAPLNAISIYAVPEPSGTSLSLVGLAALAMTRFRRR